MNLSLLSIYSFLFQTPAARAAALVPQQAMTIAGLLLGMTLPALLSDDWRDPAAFSRSFVLGLGVLTFVSSTLLSAFEKGLPEASQSTEQKGAVLGRGPASSAAAGVDRKLHEAQRMGGAQGGLRDIMENKGFQLLLLNVFLAQVGFSVVCACSLARSGYFLNQWAFGRGAGGKCAHGFDAALVRATRHRPLHAGLLLAQLLCLLMCVCARVHERMCVCVCL